MGSSGTRRGTLERRMQEKRTVGWREWLALPELGVDRLKAKVDTGARSSSLHAFDVEVDGDRPGATVSFGLHPLQRSSATIVRCEAHLHEYRFIRSSNGQRERRPIIRTTILLGGQLWPIEVALTSRDAMGFRMLLGRQAIRGLFVVDPGRSYVCRELLPERKKRKKKST